jgi:hypothetical protein
MGLEIDRVAPTAAGRAVIAVAACNPSSRPINTITTIDLIEPLFLG